MPDAARSAPSASLPGRRVLVAGATTVLVLSVAVIAGLASDPTGGTPVIFVSRLSSAIDGLATRDRFTTAEIARFEEAFSQLAQYPFERNGRPDGEVRPGGGVLLRRPPPLASDPSDEGRHGMVW